MLSENKKVLTEIKSLRSKKKRKDELKEYA